MEYLKTLLTIITYWAKFFIRLFPLTFLCAIVIAIPLLNGVIYNLFNIYSAIIFLILASVLALIPITGLMFQITHFMQGKSYSLKEALRETNLYFSKIFSFVFTVIILTGIYLCLPILSSPAILSLLIVLTILYCANFFLDSLNCSSLMNKIIFALFFYLVVNEMNIYMTDFGLTRGNLWPIVLVLTPGLPFLFTPAWPLVAAFLFIVFCHVASGISLIPEEKQGVFVTLNKSIQLTKKSMPFVVAVYLPIFLLIVAFYLYGVRLDDYLIMHFEIGYIGQGYLRASTIPLIILLVLPLLSVAMVVVTEKLKQQKL